MSLIDQQNAFMSDVIRLVSFAQSLGFQVTLGEGFRTPEQQALYLKSGASQVKVSQHQKRLAIDLQFFRNGRWVTGPTAKEELKGVGRFWEEATPGRNRWGGNFPTLVDTPHFERQEI